jgi:hypothetical protein
MSETTPEPQPGEPTPGEPSEPTPDEPSEPEGIDYGGSQSDIAAAKEKSYQADRERLAAEHEADEARAR